MSQKNTVVSIFCHVQTAVTGVRKVKTIGKKSADGEFYIVKIRIFSDAGGATLGLHDVDAKLMKAMSGAVVTGRPRQS